MLLNGSLHDKKHHIISNSITSSVSVQNHPVAINSIFLHKCNALRKRKE
jgi:hypothetical protein